MPPGIHLSRKFSVEMGEELAVSSSQSKDCDLRCSVQLVDAVLFCPNVWALSPLCSEAVS